MNHSIFAGGLNLLPNFQKKGSGEALQDHNFKMRVAGEDGGVIFQGGWWCSFYMKNKLNSEIFNKKSLLRKMFSSASLNSEFSFF